jgi:Flp pilus assembly pilin Flp
MLKDFLEETRGQDLIEYTLLLGAIALAGAGSIIGISSVLDRIWNIINGRLDNASN